jgi:hypothetical protein
MENKEFINKICELYKEARKPKFRDNKILRGRSHSISSSAEDLLALFLVKNINPDLLYIDQPISVEGIKGVKYPDIIIVNNGEVTNFCDLKMDMGWNRSGLYGLCEEQFNWIKTVRGKTCRIKDGISKKISYYKISADATNNIIVVSDQNSNKSLYNQIEKTKKMNPVSEVFLLTSGKHLNSYKISVGELVKEINIKNEEFEKLIEKLRN